MLQIGNKPVDTMYVGGKLVQKAYLGSKKVYPEHGVIPNVMKYIILPIEDAQIVFTEEELSTMRKSTDGTQVIVHENILVDKRNQLGLVTLPVDGVFEWTYPVYEYDSDELNNLLSSKQWTNEE